MMALLPALLGGCDWFTNFTRQPKIDPWEVATMTDTARRDSIPPRGNPQGSVPMIGSAVPEWVVSYQPLPGTVDSLSGLQNPTAPGEASLANGRILYQINCAVCHGDTGDGRGPLATRGYNFPPIPPVASGNALTLSDGYIYGIIRNGRGLMPTYNRIEDMERWDVVNYIRGLQGRLGQAVPTGPVGQPGEGGVRVPGATLTAPTRPVPHRPGMLAPARPGPAPGPPPVRPGGVR
jgi:mono/diheme cytochrome c family protein